MEQLPDRQLCARVRDGSLPALAQLWTRHSAYGMAVSHGLATSDNGESINARAWTLVLDATPDDLASGFRPYLYLLIRAIASTEDSAPKPDAILTTAYHRLPSLWREALWYAQIDFMKASQISPLIGTPAEEIPALLHLAREGLRREWIQVHIDRTAPDSVCRMVWEMAEAYLHGSVPVYDRAFIEQHTKTCRVCRPVDSDAITVASHLRQIVLPTIAGVGGAASLLSYLRINGPCIPATMPLPTIVEELIFPGNFHQLEPPAMETVRPDPLRITAPKADTRPVAEPASWPVPEPSWPVPELPDDVLTVRNLEQLALVQDSAEPLPANPRHGLADLEPGPGTTGPTSDTAFETTDLALGTTDPAPDTTSLALDTTIQIGPVLPWTPDRTTPVRPHSIPRSTRRIRPTARPASATAHPPVRPTDAVAARIDRARAMAQSARPDRHDNLPLIDLTDLSDLSAPETGQPDTPAQPGRVSYDPTGTAGPTGPDAATPVPLRKPPARRPSWRPAVAGIAALAVVVLSVMGASLYHLNAQPGSVPSAPARIEANLSARITAVDTGPSNNLFPVIRGTAPANATVDVAIGDADITVTADQQGSWTTAGATTEPSDTEGSVTATVPEDSANPATALFELVTPPTLTVTADTTPGGSGDADSSGDAAAIIVNGLGNADVDILVDGNTADSVQLSDSGSYTGQLDLSNGNHFLQVRYADHDRRGPSSQAQIITV